MLPPDLRAEEFATWPPQARALAVANLATLRQLPLSFLPSLLRELVDYDFKFPAERATIDRELSYLRSLSAAQLAETFHAFSQIKLSKELEQLDWVNRAAQFVEQESAYLWTTHALDAFREAATRYGDQLRTATPPPALQARRLGIAVVGKDVAAYDDVLFRNLLPHGTYFTKIDPANGLQSLITSVEQRALDYPAPYAHWYIDGGQPTPAASSVTTVSYRALDPLRASLLQFIETQIARPGMGPEELRTNLARLAPPDLGIDLGMDPAGDPVLDRFQMKVLTEGSGTQIFSTTFAQWTAREALRRAEPLTLLVRFAPRQRQRPMNELLANRDTHPELDPIGSLIDAQMAAYYHWINQQRLPESERSAFVVWFEGHGDALVIAPTLPRGARSTSPIDLRGLVKLALC